MSVLVVGSVAYDSIKTAAESRVDILGGSATYFSLAASLMSGVRIVAVVGEDFKQEHIDLLNRHGADTTGLQRVAGGETFRWSGVYSDDFVERTTLETHLNVFEKFQPQLNEQYRKTTDLFLANIMPALQTDVLDQMENTRFVACDTMNLWINTAREDLDAVMKRVDLLVINDEESFLLTGKRNIHQAAPEILAMGPKYLIVKRGEFGCALFAEGKSFLLPAFPVQNVSDPTGAGDSFAGGMMGYLSGCETIGWEQIKQAIVTGTVMASFTVEDFSVDRLTGLTAEQLSQRIRAFGEQTQWSDFEIPTR